MSGKIDMQSQNQYPTNLTSYSDQQIDNLIQLLINYKDNYNRQLIDIYNVDYILNLIDKSKIQQIEFKFKSHGQRGVDIIDFIRILLIVLQNKDFEIIYITISLIDLFKEISESINMAQYIQYSDFTAFICDYFVQKKIKTYKIETVKMPEQKKFHLSNQVREIDISPPVVFGENDEQITRFNVNTLRTDSQKHNNLYIQDGYFAAELKRIITLDSLSSHLKIYKFNCKQDKILKVDPKSEKNIFIMSFAYSDRQQRIGVTLKDLSLLFLDWADKFQKQKIFSINQSTSEYQTQIWYIDMIQTWVTTDRSNAINAWDIEYERISWQLIDKEVIKSSVIDIKELTHAKLIAIASQDKKVTIWNFFARAYVLTIDLSSGGVHHIAYSYNYQVLVTVGYENVINIFSISPLYIDYNKEGTLVGHASMVTAIELVHNTPMLISSDDSGTVKLWDIRNMKCIQTLNIGSKSTIYKIINIPFENIACFLGSRMTILEFEKNNTQELDTENFYPIKAEYNKILEQLVVATRKDIRFINIKDGKVQKILTGLLKFQEDEIVEFKQINQFKMFIIADQKGRLTMFNFNNGEEVKQLQRHQNEVSNLYIDYTNKLIISSSWDSSIIIQSETQNGSEIKRMISNSNNKKEIQHLEICLYHNIIITGSNDNKLYIYDFEYVRLIGCIDLPNNAEPSCLSFINGFQILMVGTNDGKIYLIHLFTSELKIIYSVLCVIDLQSESRSKLKRQSFYSQNEAQESENQFQPKFYAVKLLSNILISSPDNMIQKCVLYIGMSNGLIQIFDIREILLKSQLKFVEHANTSANYNPYRQVNEDFMNIYKQIDKQSFIVFKYIKENQESIQFVNETHKIKEFYAHKDVILQLHFIDIGQEKNIFTCSSDKFIKIWNISGNLLASVNINHPLPLYWNLDLEKTEKQKKKIFFAFKILDITKQKYQHDKILDNILKVNTFISNLLEIPNPIDFQHQNLTIDTKNIKSVRLMQDEFSPRDLKYKEVKPFFENELRGMSLRQMETTQRLIQTLQQQQSDQQIYSYQNEQMNIAKKISDDRESLIFLQLNYRERILKQQAEREMDDSLAKLNKKMDKMTNKNPTQRKKDQLEKDTKIQTEPKVKKEETSKDKDAKFQDSDSHQLKNMQISDQRRQSSNKQFETTVESTNFQPKRYTSQKFFLEYAQDKKLLDPIPNITHTSINSMNHSQSLANWNNQKSQIQLLLRNLDKQVINAQHSVYGNLRKNQNQINLSNISHTMSDKFKTHQSMGNSKFNQMLHNDTQNSITLHTIDNKGDKSILPQLKISIDFNDQKLNTTNKSNMYFNNTHNRKFKTQSNTFNLPNLDN